MLRAQSVWREQAGCMGDRGRGDAGQHSKLGATMEGEVGEPGVHTALPRPEGEGTGWKLHVGLISRALYLYRQPTCQ